MASDDEKVVQRPSSTVYKYIIVLILCAAFLFFIIDSCTKQYSIKFVSWLMRRLAEYNILLMTFLFLLVTTFSLVLVFPTGILGLSGGYLFATKLGFSFGFSVATIINLVGNVMGSAMTFRVSLFLYGNERLRKEDTHEILWGIRKALEKKGKTINTLLRLTPIVPGAVLNYCLPPLGTKLDDFLFGVFFGTIPYALLLSFLGAALHDSTSIEDYFVDTSLAISIPVAVVAFGSLVSGIYLIYKYASEALQNAMEDEEEESLIGNSGEFQCDETTCM